MAKMNNSYISPLFNKILSKFNPDKISVQSWYNSVVFSFRKGNYSFYMEYYTPDPLGKTRKYYLTGFKLDIEVLDFYGRFTECFTEISKTLTNNNE